MPFAFGDEKVRRAGPVGAEMKIKADCRSGHGEALDQDALDEILSGQVCQRLVEREHDGAVEPGGGEEAQFGCRVGQAEQRLAGMEEGPRVRLEGQRRRRPPKRRGPLLRRRNHRLMAAVHAVKIADGDDRAGKRLIWRAGRRGIAHDAEILHRHRGLRWLRTGLRDDPEVVPSHGRQSQGTAGTALVGSFPHSG